MNNVDNNADAIPGEIPQRAVSIYGQGEGMEDFPVLKAFQQYIDAEQEKARRRILTIGIFFGVVLATVVAVFLFLLHGINVRNQALSDRLVDYAMREADRRQTATIQQQQPPAVSSAQIANEAAFKAVNDTLTALQRKIDERPSVTADSVVRQPDAESVRKVFEEQEKIRRERESLQIEKKRLEEEKERLRQIEIDRQRRKLYPELYEEKKPKAKAQPLSDDDIREIIREAFPEEDRVVVKKNKVAEDSEKPTTEDTDVDDVDPSVVDSAIEYFKDDNYTIPVDVRGSSSKTKVQFTVPIE